MTARTVVKCLVYESDLGNGFVFSVFPGEVGVEDGEFSGSRRVQRVLAMSSLRE